MDERKQIAEDTLDQLIEQALRELDRVEMDWQKKECPISATRSAVTSGWRKPSGR